MRIKWFHPWLILSMVSFAFVPLAGNASATAAPFVEIGPKAVQVKVVSPNQAIFSCQVGMDPGVVCYDPYQMRHAYGIDTLISAGLTGAGRTIVIIDAFQSPTLPSDLDTFDTNYGLPARSTFFSQVAPDGLTPFDPSNADMVGWSAEITLDVEWAHAIAPGAKVVLVLSKSDQDADILSATTYAVDHKLGNVISQSFGENESCVDSSLLKSEHNLFAKATLEGITLLASSGDEGAAQPTCDGSSWVKAASSPASDPLVTAVGGTELHAADYCLSSLGCDPSKNPAPGTYEGEVAWNEFNSDATGGGFSVLYPKPAYQLTAFHGSKGRGVPDVAYNAAIYHGVLVFWDASWYLFGGTSCGSPQWAGIVAIADQKAGRSLGFINWALYLFNQASSKNTPLFHDITKGTNSVVEKDSGGNPVSVQGFNAGPGWDATTGLGSPYADRLVSFVIRYASPNDANQAIAQSAPAESGHSGPHRVDTH